MNHADIRQRRVHRVAMGNLDKEEMQDRITALQRQACRSFRMARDASPILSPLLLKNASARGSVTFCDLGADGGEDRAEGGNS